MWLFYDIPLLKGLCANGKRQALRSSGNWMASHDHGSAQTGTVQVTWLGTTLQESICWTNLHNLLNPSLLTVKR